MRFINLDLLKEWVNNRAIISDITFSKKLSQILNELPWLAGHVDFNEIENVTASITNLLNDESKLCFEKICQWLDQCKINHSEYIAFWYSEDQPCVVCEREFALANIDSAYWGVPGWNYMFGCSVKEGKIIADYNEILCYDSADTLVIIKK
ncbi:hypothetical protein SNN58_003327 [Cronobacter dublinensis]|uniref:hypothetical protein n=1 Tax=Cronobacter dublinensis TaxID=413497 RepID=UPI0023DC1230|nr:hypothetical protein [Cronobacter dublinensis]ELY2798507.1 hypothetical protein [Cronobacter dublinensis]ELY3973284.1 hypothetical protein [Cronobacter dublinensis]ELY4487889.1 hypothetical protein [Cronobacter dublinensis]ELY5824763.1 hypothetical protein [Cronobacter dublinensis]WEP49823.1 hypothetical protein NMY27_00885 [Cronobacter dublinensis]